jgi:hypothetical protein
MPGERGMNKCEQKEEDENEDEDECDLHYRELVI